MLNLQLHIRPRTERRLKKILEYTHDQETFAQNIISYKIAELKKGIFNIKLDIREFEDRYHISAGEFYRQFEQGMTDDTEDFIIWAGLCEMLRENKEKLKGLE